MSSKYLDFDAMLAESESEKEPCPVIKYKGKENIGKSSITYAPSSV